MPDKDHVASREFVVEIGAECHNKQRSGNGLETREFLT
jgi:hypothetical protein